MSSPELNLTSVGFNPNLPVSPHLPTASNQQGCTMGRKVTISSRDDPVSRLSHPPLPDLSTTSNPNETSAPSSNSSTHTTVSEAELPRVMQQVARSKNLKFFNVDENGKTVRVSDARDSNVIIDEDNKKVYYKNGPQKMTHGSAVSENSTSEFVSEGKKLVDSIFPGMHLADDLKASKIKESIKTEKDTPMETIMDAKTTLAEKQKALRNARIKGIAYRALGIGVALATTAAAVGLVIGTGGIGTVPALVLMIGGVAVAAGMWRQATPLLKEVQEAKGELANNVTIQVLSAYSQLCEQHGEEEVNRKLEKSFSTNGTNSCFSLGNKQHLTKFVYALQEAEKEITGEDDSSELDSVWDLLKVSIHGTTLPNTYEEEHKAQKKTGSP